MANDSVQLIKEKLSIIDVISPYVELHKAGKNYKGKSPFTAEKTPSFYVSPDRGMYYCFSSSQGGDMFTFVEKMEGVDFKGALKILAEKAGVELVREDPKARDHRDHLYQALQSATDFFAKTLETSTEAKAYLDRRKVKDETVKQWQIGYALNDWRQLKEHLNQKGFDDNVLLSAGLIKRAEGGKQPYDVFRDRIMFPISDASGRVVGFSGRILSKDSEAPKYVNSPETILFNKSEALFGYDKAKQGIHKLDFSLIVEGQFDVVLSHQAGYKNAVAVSGTALTASHVSLLQRLSNKVVLALDSDRAGVNAVKRAAELMLARGIDLKVARLHGGKDPADLVAEDPALLKKDIGDSRHVIEFLLEILKEESKDERRYKVRVRDEILSYLLLLESHIERDHFAKTVAEAIDTTVEAVRLEIARLESAKTSEPQREAPAATPTNPAPADKTKRRRTLVYYLAILEELLETSEAHMLAERYTAILGRTPKELREDMSMAEKGELTFKLEERLEGMRPTHIREEWESGLKELEDIITKEKILAAKEALRQAEEAGDEDKVSALIAEIDELKHVRAR